MFVMKYDLLIVRCSFGTSWQSLVLSLVGALGHFDPLLYSVLPQSLTVSIWKTFRSLITVYWHAFFMSGWVFILVSSVNTSKLG